MAKRKRKVKFSKDRVYIKDIMKMKVDDIMKLSDTTGKSKIRAERDLVKYNRILNSIQRENRKRRKELDEYTFSEDKVRSFALVEFEKSGGNVLKRPKGKLTKEQERKGYQETRKLESLTYKERKQKERTEKRFIERSLNLFMSETGTVEGYKEYESKMYSRVGLSLEKSKDLKTKATWAIADTIRNYQVAPGEKFGRTGLFAAGYDSERTISLLFDTAYNDASSFEKLEDLVGEYLEEKHSLVDVNDEIERLLKFYGLNTNNDDDEDINSFMDKFI